MLAPENEVSQMNGLDRAVAQKLAILRLKGEPNTNAEMETQERKSTSMSSLQSLRIKLRKNGIVKVPAQKSRLGT